MAVLVFQTLIDVYHSGVLARSYRNHGACFESRLKYKQLLSGVVDSIDTGQLGTEALRTLEEVADAGIWVMRIA